MERGKVELIADLMEQINNGISASGQMIHQRSNVKFMAIRDMLSIMRNSILKYVKDMELP